MLQLRMTCQSHRSQPNMRASAVAAASGALSFSPAKTLNTLCVADDLPSHRSQPNKFNCAPQKEESARADQDLSPRQLYYPGEQKPPATQKCIWNLGHPTATGFYCQLFQKLACNSSSSSVAAAARLRREVSGEDAIASRASELEFETEMAQTWICLLKGL